MKPDKKFECIIEITECTRREANKCLKNVGLFIKSQTGYEPDVRFQIDRR